MANEYLKRIQSEQRSIVRVTNNDLVCIDCLLRFDDSEMFGNTSKCEAFPQIKPTEVLAGKECTEYVNEG